jgi:glutaredoxin-like protein
MAPLLDDEVKQQVKDVFAELTEPVEIILFTSEKENCEYCQDTTELLTEITQLSDKLSIQKFDLQAESQIAAQYKIDKAPGFVLLGREGDDLHDYGIRYYGIPAGHEFTSLINDILIISKRDSGLAKETREELSKLTQPVKLQVFVTPTCPYCPRAVVLAHQIAFESDQVEAEMVEAMEFNDLANQFNVSGVPHTVINAGRGEVVGAVPEAHLLQKIQQTLA